MTRVRLDEPTNIQEPVLSEKRSCFKGGCFSSCGCLVMLGLLLLLVLRITWGPRTIPLSQLPIDFPAANIVHDTSSAVRIKVTKAALTSRALSTATALPRLLYKPASSALASYRSGNSWFETGIAFSNEVRRIFATPATDSAIDIYTITWVDPPEDIETVRSFYTDAFARINASVKDIYNNDNTYEAHFENSELSGSLLIENYDLKNDRVESITLEIHIPYTIE